MEDKKKKSILIDATVILDSLSEQGEGLYAKPFLHSLIEEMLNDEAIHWEIFLLGFHDLNQNLIEIGFSSFAIEEIKEKIEFIGLGAPIKKHGFNSRLWTTIDKAIYEIEPDIFQSFNFETGLPSTPNITHTYSDVKTTVYLPSLKTDLTNPKFNLFGLTHFFQSKRYKKMLAGVISAEKVLVPNQTVKTDLIKLDESLESKIEIFYPGINKEFTTEKESLSVEEIENLGNIYGVDPGKYLLSDYSFVHEEEIDLFISILTALFNKKDFESIATNILLVGKDFYKGVGDMIEPRTNIGTLIYRKLKSNNLLKYTVTTGTVDNNEFVPILDNSAAYILITTDNGFNFGPIRAMSQGVPIFIDNIDILATNMAKYINLVDSSKPAAAAKTIYDILSDEEEIKMQRKRSRKASKKYSWEGAVIRYIKLLKLILNIEAK